MYHRKEQKMKKNVLFKILTLILSMVLLFSLSGCAEDKEARVTLTKMFDTLKEGDYNKALSNYIINTDDEYNFINCTGEFTKEDFPAYDMHLAVFKSLEYKITGVKVVDETHTIYTVDISALDLSPIGRELAQTTAAYNITAANAEDGEQLSENELNEILTHHMVSISHDHLNGDTLKTISKTLEVTLHYDAAKGWQVHINPELAAVLNGGVYNAFYEEAAKSDMVTK